MVDEINEAGIMFYANTELLQDNSTVHRNVVGLCLLCPRKWGHETLILFAKEVQWLLEQLQQSLASKAKTQFGDDFELTFSGGVLSAQSHLTSSSVLEKVDSALYQAKTTRRNKIVCN